jgi:hypothetical protein
MNVHLLKGSDSEFGWMLCEMGRQPGGRDVVLRDREALQSRLPVERFRADQSNLGDELDATLDVPARRVMRGKRACDV